MSFGRLAGTALEFVFYIEKGKDMADQFARFKKVLRELFMIDDAADLDFGIYRIMHQKQNEIEEYLNVELRKQVTEEITQNSSRERQQLQQEIEQLSKKAIAIEMNPDDVPAIKEKKQQLAALGDDADLEAEVYNHLATFFGRYYEGGDFVSLRRYKKDVYAIPYEGEDVKMYWANHDQYYIKTSEYLHNYSFRLSDGRQVVFRVVEASQDQNNNKPGKDTIRCFALAEGDGQTPVEVNGQQLTVNFTYELMPKATNLQKKLVSQANEKIESIINELYRDFFHLLDTIESESNPTLLQKHLNSFVARNTFDYFIHKDLNGFLSRELDFYIKNEILFIDDIDSRNANDFVQYLAVVKAVKAVGKTIITFLAGLENFQKKLWLKKKFVVESNFCITLDRVPEEFYAEIVANDSQREEWVKLFDIKNIPHDLQHQHVYSEPLTVEFLKENSFLVLDTGFFPIDFKRRLVESIGNFDSQCDGLLINSDNFQALKFLKSKYLRKVKCIYADPPYNTSASEILYKNSYRDSSWLSLMNDRLLAGKDLLRTDGLQCTTIDDVEESKLKLLLTEVFGKQPSSVSIRVKPSGRPIPNDFAISHEYALFSKNDGGTPIERLPHTEDQEDRYRERDEKGPFLWELLRKAGSNSFRQNRPTMFYPIYLNKSTGKMRIPDMEYDDIKEEYDILENTAPEEIVVYPIKDDGKDGRWYYGLDTAKKEVSEFKAELQDNGLYYVYRRRRKNEGVQPTTFWENSKYSATEHGTDLLKRIFGEQETFSYPKSIYAVEDSLSVMGPILDDVVLDYFAGSGTTGHAVINLNREGGNRKYILIEMGEYCGTVTKPRIEKVVYSKDWNEGRPVSREGISQCFKYITLEQYEDTLNNLVVKERDRGIFGKYSDTYLGYMLDTETRESLFSVESFDHPFDVTMNITRGNESKETALDMVETFNYLIGLYVDHECWPQDGICIVDGKTRTGKNTLVLWRDTEKVDNEKLNAFFLSQGIDIREKGYEQVFVNGDNNLENLRQRGDLWHVSLIEEEFKKRMFEEV